MKRWSVLLLFAFLLALVFFRVAYADYRRFAVSEELSTLFLGKNFTTWLTCSPFTSTGLDCQNLSFIRTTGIAEYNLFGSNFSFRKSSPLSSSELNGKEKTWYEYAFDPKALLPAELGIREATIDFAKLAPHVGIDWGHGIGENNKWVVSFDLGITLQDSPNLHHDSDASVTTNPNLLADLDREKQDLTDQIRNASQFFGLGITYKF